MQLHEVILAGRRVRTFSVLCLALLPTPIAAQATPAAPAFHAAGAFAGLSVPDLEASTRWYEEKLGMRVIFRPPPYEGTSVVVLEGGGLTVELLHNPAAVPLRTAAPSISHTTLVHGPFKVGIVVNDYDQALARLRERGVTVVAGPFPARDAVPANFMIRDNAGNLIQLFGR
ncbi:MAG TPA: VOC family protein [Gemmatimonadaceae bacterium]|nr:VOC family protein [Gemmatimonadaceae bacterium]